MSEAEALPARITLFLATSNPGKRREFQALARQHSGGLAAAAAPAVEVQSLAEIDALPRFDESAPTFAENAAGKALHYSRYTAERVVADDSGLVVPALGGAPGPRSARYAGPGASDAERVRKLLEDLRDKRGDERRARFVCVLAMARAGRALAVVSEAVEGVIAEAPRGTNGFGYDPVFIYEPLGCTFAELSQEAKNGLSHRGKAFHRLLVFLRAPEEFLLG